MTDFYEKEGRWEVNHFMGMAHAKDSGNFVGNSNGKIRFGFSLTRIFGITSGSGPLISVGIFRPKFTVPILKNRFIASLLYLNREFGKG